MTEPGSRTSGAAGSSVAFGTPGVAIGPPLHTGPTACWTGMAGCQPHVGPVVAVRGVVHLRLNSSIDLAALFLRRRGAPSKSPPWRVGPWSAPSSLLSRTAGLWPTNRDDQGMGGWAVAHNQGRPGEGRLGCGPQSGTIRDTAPGTVSGSLQTRG